MTYCENDSIFLVMPATNRETIIALVAAADSAFKDNKRRWLPVLGKVNPRRFEGVDLALRYLADGEKDFPGEPVFPLYRAAYSVNNAVMRHDKVMHRIYLAATALERAHAAPSYIFPIRGRRPLAAIDQCATYCARHQETVIGARLVTAAELFYPSNSILSCLRAAFDMQAELRRTAAPARPAMMAAASLPVAIDRPANRY